jgi:hypothetical protein
VLVEKLAVATLLGVWILLQSRHAVSSIAAEEQNGTCTEYLREATQNETAKTHLEGPTLLHAIEAIWKNTIASLITSNVKYQISYLCYNGLENIKWICKVGQSFWLVRYNGFLLFAAHVNKVTVSFTSFLLQMTRSVADVCLAVDRVSWIHKDYCQWYFASVW